MSAITRLKQEIRQKRNTNPSASFAPGSKKGGDTEGIRVLPKNPGVDKRFNA